jgi:hypothetical protein
LKKYAKWNEKVIEKGQRKASKARVNNKHIEQEDYARLMGMVVHAKMRSKRVDEAYLEHEARRKVVEEKKKCGGNKVVELIMD